MKILLIGMLVFLLHQQYASAQEGIRITCPETKAVGADGNLQIVNPMIALDIQMTIDVITYIYLGRTETYPANAQFHFLTGFTLPSTPVEVSIRDPTTSERALCTFRAIRAVSPSVSCPDPITQSALNRLNPLSPNSASIISFNSPTLSSFPNNANVQLQYRFSNFDVSPQVNNQLLTTIQSTQASHSLQGLECGSNQVTVTATDNAGNTATCTFTYYRLCVVCPNPVQSTQTSTNFARPSINFPNNALTTYTYTLNGQQIGTFQFNQAATHFVQGYQVGSNFVTLTVSDSSGNIATCTYTYIRTGVTTSVNCPNPTNPSSPNAASQITFNSPTLSGFPNNANVQLQYRLNNQLLTTLPSTQATHNLQGLQCGSNTVTVTATDNAGNTASCTFTYFRLCVVCPNPVQSTQTSTNFARPSINFPNNALTTYAYTLNGQQISTFQFNQAATHFVQGYQVGSNFVTLTVSDSSGNRATCTYTYIRTGVTTSVNCPNPTNPSSPNAASQITFNSPTLSGFPNNANVQLQYRLNNQLLTTLPSTQATHNLQGLQCGSNTVTVTATDNAGNTASCTFTYFRLCVVCPNPVQSTQTSTNFARPSINFPNNALTTYAYTLNGQQIGTFQFNQAATHFVQGYQVGSNFVTLTVSDSSGNSATCTYSYIRTGVTTSVACPNPTNPSSPNAASQITFNSPTLSGFPNNANVQLQYRLNNQLLTTLPSTQATHNLQGLQCGSNTVTVTATDNAGNTASCIFTYFRLCVVCPNPAQSTQTSTNFARPSINFPNNALTTYAYTLNGQQIGTFQFNQAATHFVQGYQVGSNFVTLTVSDSSGNRATCTYTYINTRVPTSVNCPNPTNPSSPNSASQITFNSPTLSGFPNNANVQLQYRLNNQLLTTLPSTQATHNLQGLQCGSNTVTVTATDNGGNTASCTFTYFRLCVVCPNPAQSTQTSTNFARPSINFPNNALTTYAYTLNGQQIGTFQFNQAATHFVQGYQVGSNFVTLTVSDSSGNRATCTYTYINTRVPTSVNCPNPTNPSSPNSASQISFNSPTLSGFPNNANVQLQYRLNNQLLTTLPSTQATHNLQGLQCGSNTVTVTATDNGGNTASCTFTYFRLCLTCPNPVQSSQTSTTFARPSINFPNNALTTYRYTLLSGQQIGTFSFNQATTHFLQGYQVGQNAVTLIVTDNSGNSATCTYNYVVRATLSITCSPQQTVGTDGNLVITNPRTDFNIQGNANTITYTYLGRTQTEQATGSFHSLTGFPVGNTPVVVQVTDGIESASCNFQAVRSCTSPTVQCGQNVISQVPCGQTTTQTCFQQQQCQGFDNSGITPQVQYSSGGIQLTQQGNQLCGNFQPGVTTVRGTATNSCNLSGSDTFTVTITDADNSPPQITCPENIVREINCGATSTFVQFTATAQDDCGPASVTYSSSGATFFQAQPQGSANMNVGTSTITATATDSSQRTSNCQFTVNVNEGDQTPPQVTCGQDLFDEVPCGQSTARVCFQTCTVFDNSGITPQAQYSTNTGVPLVPQFNQYCGEFSPGVHTIRATASDNCGLTGSDTITITVSPADQTPPRVICGQDVSSQVQCGQANTQVCFQPCTSTDNAGNPQVQYSSGFIQFTPQGNQVCATYPAGLTTVTARATDNCGLTGSDTITVTVSEVDNSPPQITCPANVVREINCGVTSTFVQFTATAQDNCGAASVTYSSSGATFFQEQPQGSASMNVGTSTITSIATDSSQRTATCQFTVNVNEVDNSPPQINCPANIARELNCGVTSTLVQFTATAQDNCGSPTITYRSSGATFFQAQPQGSANMNVGTSTITATATDSSQRTANCQFTVNVNEADQTPPRVICGQDVSSQVQCGQANTQVCFQPCTSTDNAGNPQVQYSSGFISFTPQGNQVCATYPAGLTTVTARATDNCGLTGSDTITVTVSEVDNSPPQITCPANVVREINCGVTSTFVQFTATAQDNCGAASVTYSSSGATFFQGQPQGSASMNVGTSTITSIATDSSQRTATCQFTVNVNEVDNSPPQINCPANIARELNCGVTSTLVQFTATAQDNCGSPTITYRSSGATFFQAQPQGSANMNVGTSTITATATDSSQRTANCQFTVNVNEVDRNPPTIQCPANQQTTICTGQGNSRYTFNPATATDNCGAVSVQYSGFGATNFQLQPQNNAPFNLGTTTVSATTTDSSGQSANCQFSVTVNSQDPCANHNCQNGGQCSAFPGSCSQYYCVCPPCYYGRFCENRIDACENHQCANGAVCQAQPNSCTDYTCTCPTCFTGPFCQTTAPDPCINSPCINGGRCSRLQGSCYAYQCDCQVGYEGNNCEIRTQVYVNPCNNFPCENGGYCNSLANNNYVCTCRPDYGGINCQTPIAASPNFESCGNNPCQNNGECFNGYDQNSAVQGFYRNQYTCVCNQGFGGSNCLTNLATNPVTNECTGVFCRNGGTCDNAYFSFAQRTAPVCNCNIGFFGQFCETSIDNPCLSNPCQNGGTCTAFNTFFICECFGQFSGTTCEQGGGGGGDFTPPTLQCPANQQAQGQGQGTCQQVTYQVNAFDNSGGNVQLSYSNPPGSSFSLGVTTVQVTGTDPSGNVATCSFTVTCSTGGGGDFTPPTLQCPANQQAQGLGTCTVTYQVNAFDNSGGNVQLTYSNPPGSSFSNGVTTVQVTGTDSSGNTATCSFTVTCSTGGGGDFTPPTLQCPANQQAQGQGQGTCQQVTYQVNAFDNSGGNVQLTYSNPPGSSFPLGVTTVQVTGTDPSGNIGTCSFTVTCSTGGGGDFTPPTLQCPANQQAQGLGTCQVTYQVNAFDNSGGFVQLQYSNPPGSSFPLGVTNVQVTGTDPSGNIGTCSFTVTCSTVDGGGDFTPPTLQCPANQQAQGLGTCTVTYQVNAFDNSGGNVQLTYSNPPGSSFPLGVTTVQVTGRDPSGNIGTCSFTVTCSTGGGGDFTPPTLQCPANQQAQGQGLGTCQVSYQVNAFDNSGGNVQLTYSNPPGSSFSLGVTTVQVTGTDPSGNIGTCSFTVTCSTGGSGDFTPPTLQCPANQQATGQGTCTVTYQVNAFDNSGGNVQLTYSNPSGSSFSIGVTTVRVTGTDPSGNIGTCSFTVTCSTGTTTVDSQAPWLTCPENQVATVSQGQGGTAVTYPVAVANDNSGQNVQLSYSPSGSFFSVGTTVVTVTATDPSGNSAECVFAVTVNYLGQNVPTVTGCNAASSRMSVDTTGTLAAGQSSQQVTWNVPQAQPPGTIVRTHNSLNSGSQFTAGLTEIVYIFGNPGSESTCTYRVYVLGLSEHPCTSSPCPATQTCFFSQNTYLCQNPGRRKRRDLEDEPYCGLHCEETGGFCASENHFGDLYDEPQCFYQAYQVPEFPPDPCDVKPCMNNGTCAPIYDIESSTRYFCFCPPGLEGKHCELKSYLPHDDGAVDYMQEDGSMMLGYWFIYILLGVICLVVLFQSVVMCQLVAKQMKGVKQGYYKHMDDKVVVY